MSEPAVRRHLRVVYGDEPAEAAEPLTYNQRRSRRKRDVRARTISVKHMPKRELDLGRVLFPEVEGVERPVTRADCAGGERPCPFVSCKHHLYLDVKKTGAIRLNFPDLEVWDMTESCSLDVADRGGATLEEAGAMLNITRERLRQIEVNAEDRFRKHAPQLADARDDSATPGESQLASIMSSNGGAGTSDDDDERTADGDWKPRPKNLFANEGTDEGDAAFVGALYDRALRERGALESGERRVWNGHYLNPRHGAVLDVLPRFFEAHGRGPTFRELAQFLDPDGAVDQSSVVGARSSCVALRDIGAVEWSRTSGVVMRQVVSEAADGPVSQGCPGSSTAGEMQEKRTMANLTEKQQSTLDAFEEGLDYEAIAKRVGSTAKACSIAISRMRAAGLVKRAPMRVAGGKPKADKAVRRPPRAPMARPSKKSASASDDPIVVSLRERLAEIDSRREKIVAAIEALGGEVA